MSKTPTPELSETDPTQALISGEIIPEAEIERVQTQGLSRDAFLDQLFGPVDPFSLPVGHLMDHRVRMPMAIADAAIAKGAPEIAKLLSRMISMSANPQAGGLVMAAIGRSVDADAELLADASTEYPDFVRLSLSGRLGDFARTIRVPDEALFRSIVGMMAVYYGALEMQIIALRQAAIEAYRIGLKREKHASTIGEHSKDLREIYEGLKYVSDQMKRAKPGAGRRPSIVSYMRSPAEKALSDIKRKYSLTDAEITGLVARLFSKNAKKLESEAKKLDRLYEMLARKRKGASFQPLRKQVTTVAAGVQSGPQVAFAAMRLMSLAAGISQAVRHPSQGMHTKWQDCYGPIPTTNSEDLGGLFLVAIRLLRRDSTFGLPFNADGSHADLLHQIRLSQPLAIGHETFRVVRESHFDWFDRRGSAARGRMIGSANWDVLPCFRFSTSSRDHPWKFQRLPTTTELMIKSLKQQAKLPT
jgi:hypothetical protein